MWKFTNNLLNEVVSGWLVVRAISFVQMLFTMLAFHKQSCEYKIVVVYFLTSHVLRKTTLISASLESCTVHLDTQTRNYINMATTIYLAS